MTTEEKPEEHDAWTRRLAAAANNRAWTLSEQAARTSAEDQEMLHAAHAAAHLWQAVGTEHHCALAQLLLAQVHALLGHPSLAEPYANGAHQYFLGRTSEPWELALSHVVMANAANCAGKAAAHLQHYQTGVEMIDALADPEEKDILLASLRVVPRPPGG